MSTVQKPPVLTPAPVPAAPPSSRLRSFLRIFLFAHGRPGEIIVVSHSNLFYWWPIWLLGFIFAGITYFTDMHMAIVPPGTEAAENREVEVKPGQFEKRDVLILKKGAALATKENADGESVLVQPTVYVSPRKGLGTLFLVILLVVILITSAPMRGLWSVLVLLVLIMGSFIFYLAGTWEKIFAQLGNLAIHINMGGYFAFALVLLMLWLVNLYFFDRQMYMVFTPGQVRVRIEIGGAETVYDTTGMVVQKQRSDMFRHWILGFGSGDLIVRPAGTHQHFDLPNVLRIGRRVKEIELMVKEKVIVT